MGQVDVSSALAPGLDEGLVRFPRHGEVVPRKDGADRGVGILGGLVWIGFQAEELTSDVFTRSQYQSLYRAVQNLVSVLNKLRVRKPETHRLCFGNICLSGEER